MIKMFPKIDMGDGYGAACCFKRPIVVLSGGLTLGLLTEQLVNFGVPIVLSGSK